MNQSKNGFEDFKKLKPWVEENKEDYYELMAYYKCAMMAVETKFHVLSEEYSLLCERDPFTRNPIDSVRGRIKTLDSIQEKLQRRGFELTVDSIERNLDDVAGVRVICPFPSDIYRLRDALLHQDDVILVEEKDYLTNPKANGYRSLHLIIAVPIFLHDHKKMMAVEVQFRTIGMDWWAQLEHIIKYKKDFYNSEELRNRLLDCARESFRIDTEMEEIYNMSLDMRKTEDD